MGPKRKKKTLNKPKIWGLTAVLALIIVAGVFLSMYFPFQSLWIARDSRYLDLRDREMTVEEYAELCEKLPECRILWKIPIGGQRFDSTAQEIKVQALSPEDVELFHLFENLQRIHGENLECYETLEQLTRELPDCEIIWRVHLGEKSFAPTEQILNLSGSGVESSELLAELKWLENPERVELQDMVYSAEEREALRNAYPDVMFSWPLEVEGRTWLSTDTHLSYAGEKPDAQTLAAVAGEFRNVQVLDLTGCGFTIEELLLLREAYPQARIESELTLFGQTFTTGAETLDFNGIAMEDTQTLEQILPLMHSLTWVEMCDCGLSNEVMDALNKRYESIRFVWKVYFSVYALRTDATYFCAADLPYFPPPKLTDEHMEQLKYCEDMIALDLGHMRYTDLSFLEYMPKIKYLILVDARFSDITPIGTLKELKYLEIFVNTFDDLSPLLNCPELKHLNIGYTSGFDTSVLKQFTNLERLWYPGNRMSREEIRELKEALPNTLCHLVYRDDDGSTGYGWRTADVYYEMRDALHMYYIPGGTGMEGFN